MQRRGLDLLQVSVALRKTALHINVKTKFLKYVPYRISEATDTTQAGIFAEQHRAARPEDLSLLEQVYIETILPELGEHCYT